GSEDDVLQLVVATQRWHRAARSASSSLATVSYRSDDDQPRRGICGELLDHVFRRVPVPDEHRPRRVLAGASLAHQPLARQPATDQQTQQTNRKGAEEIAVPGSRPDQEKHDRNEAEEP